VGDSTVRKTNIRVVAATNKDMMQAVKDGKFREDLYYRLSTVQINVPPLRERGDDIVLLSRLFLRNFINENRTSEVTLTDDAQRLLKAYHWPGNVRQLKSVIEQVALFESGNTVDAATMRQYMPTNRKTALTVQSQPNFDYNAEREQLFTLILSMRNEIEALKKRMDGVGPTSHVSSSVHELKRESNPLLELGNTGNDMNMASPYHNMQHEPQDLGRVDEVAAMDVEGETVKTLDETERETIETALRRNNGRRKLTAQELNISERTLYRKIKQYNLERQ
jgi:DNA-binding NtrC family response regulator